MTTRTKLVSLILATAGLFLLLAGVAIADEATAVDASRTLALPTVQIWAFVAASIVPAFGYVINKYAPWVSEPVKAVFTLTLAAVSAALVQAIDTGDVGFNTETLQLVVTGVVGALLAHKWFWLTSGIAVKLGSGQNVQDR